MKNENVRKINKIGKVSRIILIILQVCLIIGIVGTIIAGCVSLALPDDCIEVNGSANAQIIVDEDTNIVPVISLVNKSGSGFSLKIDEANVNVKWLGMKLKYIVTENKLDDGKLSYDIEAAADGVTGDKIKVGIVLGCFIAAIVEILLLVALMFAKKLAKALEICESPFEDEVLKRMKYFGFALIPWAVFMFSSGISALTIVLLVLVIILFSYIFSYGAHLQQESDETL